MGFDWNNVKAFLAFVHTSLFLPLDVKPTWSFKKERQRSLKMLDSKKKKKNTFEMDIIVSFKYNSMGESMPVSCSCLSS